MIVTFDFDGTLWRWGFDPEEGVFSRSCGPDPEAIALVHEWRQKGALVHIVTSRGSSNRSEVDLFTDKFGELFEGVHFTEGCLKAATLSILGSNLHFDDDPEELKEWGQLEPRMRGILWKTGHLDENDNVCDPEDPRFHFDNWVSWE